MLLETAAATGVGLLLGAARALTQARAPRPSGFAGRAVDKAMVVRGDVRFTVLTPQLVRMEWAADGAFEDSPSLTFIDRRQPVPRFAVEETPELLTVRTDRLTLTYRKATGVFTPANLQVDLTVAGRPVRWTPGTEDPYNLKGTTRTLDYTNGAKDVTLDPGVVSRSGWALVDDSERHLFDDADWAWVKQRPPGERRDWYFFGHGHDYKQALADFTTVAGRIPVPPRWVFGYWWSRWWPYSDTELRGLVGEFRSHDLPIDVLVIDMDWHLTRWREGKKAPDRSIGWTGYTWNRALFPDPAKFLDWTGREKLKVALNLHPHAGIAPMEEQYQAFAKAYGFDASSGEYIPFRMEERRWTDVYFATVIRPIERQGVDFWWLDWQQWTESRIVPGLSVTWWLNYVFFTDMERKADRRPVIFHRWGGLGNHRYPLGFSGDTHGTWASLSYQPYFTATAANVGYGYWGHDLGGFMHVDPDPEVFVRWVQFGAMSPIFRTHATNVGSIDRRFWAHPDQFPTLREVTELRYALAPYLYNAARRAHDTGLSPCLPMYYDHPERAEAYEFAGQYMFGEDMIAAPVTAKTDDRTKLATKRVWLPEGRWYEWSSGALLDGGRVVERGFSLGELPLYVRAGAIVPMLLPVRNLSGPSDTLVLRVFPGAGGRVRVYEDDGDTDAYRDGELAWTPVASKLGPNGDVTVTIGAQEGRYGGMADTRAYHIELPGTLPPAAVLMNGRPYGYSADGAPGGWTYAGDTLTVRIVTPRLATDRPVTIVVRAAPGAAAKAALLQGKPGLFRRAADMTALIRTVKDAVPPDALVRMQEAPAAILYRPDQAATILATIDGNREQAIRDLREVKLDVVVRARVMAQLFPAAG